VPKLGSPAQVLLIAVHLCAALVLFSVWSVSRFPEFGVRFDGAPSGQIQLTAGEHWLARINATDEVTFRQGDVTVTNEAGHLRASYIQGGDPHRLALWYANQTRLTQMAAKGPVVIETPAGNFVLHPHRRNLAHLPAEFWLLLAGASGAMLCGAWVWAFRPGDWGASLFGLGSFSLAIAIYTTAIYGAREFAGNGAFLWSVTVVNYLASELYAWGSAALYMAFPRPVIKPRAWHAALVLAVVCSAAPATAFLGLNLFFRSLFLAFVVMIVFIALQWRAARTDPLARAAMRWIGLSTLASASLGVVAFIVPRLGAGEQVVSFAFGLIPMLIGYGAVAVGVGRYRLFDLDRWAYRLIAVAVAALALLVLDAGLILVLQVQPAAAIGVAFMLVALFYLPLRGVLWRLMAGKVAAIDSRLFQSAAEVAFTPGVADRRQAWRTMLTTLFDILEIELAGDEVTTPKAQAQGLELYIPATAGETALVLRYPGKGRRLFNASHVSLARELTAFMDKAEAARDSYRRGVMEERGRIAQDLHDDVGARLLSSLHRPDVEQVRADVRTAMDDIRVIVGGMAGDQILASRMVADLRNETADRLEDAGLSLDWPLTEEAGGDRTLDFWLYKNVRSAHREVVSNVLRHAKASRVRASARIEDEVLRLFIEDDGVGLIIKAAGGREGNGMRNTRRRLEQFGGRITLEPANPGLRVEIAVPLGARS